MLLNFFKNRKYDAIIAVALVVAIVTVSTYVPELFESNNEANVSTNKQTVNTEYRSPEVKVETAKMYDRLDENISLLEDVIKDSKEEKINQTKNHHINSDIVSELKKLGSLLSQTETAVNAETENAKKKTSSETIQSRADEYRNTVVSAKKMWLIFVSGIYLL